jgi:hypothetical protein
MKKKFAFILLAIIATLFVVTSCANAPGVPGTPDVYGFWWGLWNGITVWFSFFGRLFTDGRIVIYAINNTGLGYDFGFWLGTGGFVSILRMFSK